MKELYEQLTIELGKFYGQSNKAAGTRARKLCQELKVKLTEIRNDIQNTKKEM